MANTDTTKALEDVRAAEKAISDILKQSGLTQPVRGFLNDILDSLRDLDNLLMKADLDQSIDVLKQNSKALSELNSRADERLKGLKNISAGVNKASTAVDALVKAFGFLGNAGLV
jgi:methyl-accepting chemotaxis protein